MTTKVPASLLDVTIPSGPILGTPITTNGLATYEFTGLPATVRKIKLLFRNVSANGLSTGAIQVQLGTAGGYVATGYTYTNTSIDGTTITHSTGASTAFQAIFSNADANTYTGVIELTEIEANTWVFQNQMRCTASRTIVGVGEVPLGAELTRIQVFMGVGTFDGGTINILYE